MEIAGKWIYTENAPLIAPADEVSKTRRGILLGFDDKPNDSDGISYSIQSQP